MADTIDKINPISSTTKASILRKTAYVLPLRPSESGMSAEDIKKAFYSGMTDKEDSVMAELERVISEANILLQSIKECKQSNNLGVDNSNKILVTNAQGTIEAVSADTVPIDNSNKPITSSGVYNYPAIKFAESERQKSKNLLGKSELIQGTHAFSNGYFEAGTTSYKTFNPISVKPNSVVTVSCSNFEFLSGSGFVFFNDGVYVGYHAGGATTVTIPSNANQVTYDFYKEGITDDDLQYVQLEYGSVATDYQPYNGAIVHEGDISISNPNLLINGNFKVNQRGQTSYSVPYGDWAIGYSVDRWHLSAGGNAQNKGTLTVEDDGVVLTSNTIYCGIGQWIDNCKDLAGKTVTLSWKTSNKTGSFSIEVYTNYQTLTKTINPVKPMTFTLPNNLTSLRIIVWSEENATASIKIHYMKLEVGGVATALSPKPYAEELALCQRYYQKIEDINCAGFTNVNGDAMDFMVFLPCYVRTTPTLKTNNIGYVLSAGNFYNPTNVIIQRCLQNVLVVTMSGVTVTPVQTACVINFGFEIDAEMY